MNDSISKWMERYEYTVFSKTDGETKVIDGEIVEKPFIIFNKIEGDFRISAQLLVNELLIQLKKKDYENKINFSK